MSLLPLPEKADYRPRSLKLEKGARFGDWHVKWYIVTEIDPSVRKYYDPRAPEGKQHPTPFVENIPKLEVALPSAETHVGEIIAQINEASSASHYGLAFAILHRRFEDEYLTFCSWKKGNALQTRIWTRKHEVSEWTKDEDEGATTCLWDLQIIGFERNLWFLTLGTGSKLLDAYLQEKYHPQEF